MKEGNKKGIDGLERSDNIISLRMRVTVRVYTQRHYSSVSIECAILY